MDGLNFLRSLSPTPPDWNIDWTAVEAGGLGIYAGFMKDTPQNPNYHGEGDVWTHTKMVCEVLAEMEGFRLLPELQRQMLFLAALLHDIGKIRCTRLEDGRRTSPNHSSVGAAMARQILWLDYSLCGTRSKQAFRETVCALIRYHSVPPHAIELADGTRRLRAIAANGALLPDFSLRLLCLLSEADALGRVCTDRTDMLENVQLCEELAKEAGCRGGPYPFPSDFTRFAYLSGRNIPPDQPLYDDTWGPVIMLSGLPGTGKDTWLRENCPGLPRISLDQIREEMGVSPEANQGPVAERARGQAKEFLRRKQPFAWNATDLSPTLRQKQLALFHSYGASVHIVYLETGWEEQLRRNRSRKAEVPEREILRMLEKTAPPSPAEARDVRWHCV